MSNFPKYIALENFRIFQERQDIIFSPITILTGPNSSGKSTIIKSLLLLKENGLGGDLDFSAASHQLGSFENVVNDELRDEPIKISFPIKFFELKSEIELTLKFGKNGEKADFSEFEIRKKGAKQPIIALFYTGEQSESWGIRTDFPELLLLMEDYEAYMKKLLEWRKKSAGTEMDLLVCDDDECELAFLQRKTVDGIHLIPTMKGDDQIAGTRLVLGYNPNQPFFAISKETGEELPSRQVEDVINNIRISSNDYWSYYKRNTHMLHPFWRMYNFFAYLFGTSSLYDSFQGYTDESGNPVVWQASQDMPSFFFQGLGLRGKNNSNSDAILKFISRLRVGLNSVLERYEKVFGDHLQHLPSIRGNTRRVFSDQDNVSSFTELLKEFASAYPELSKIEKINEFIKWTLKEFDLGEGLLIERPEGVISIPCLLKNGHRKNLADLGFGVTQFIPILLKLSLLALQSSKMGYSKTPITIMIEEPEANLHPKLQSKLADLFHHVQKEFNIHVILETHSEYLIRRMQYLVAMGEAKPAEISLYYFHGSDQKDAGKAKRIEFRGDGLLKQDFGPGFFDEATRLTLELLNSDSAN